MSSPLHTFTKVLITGELMSKCSRAQFPYFFSFFVYVGFKEYGATSSIFDFNLQHVNLIKFLLGMTLLISYIKEKRVDIMTVNRFTFSILKFQET